jgi:hypothetical protein
VAVLIFLANYVALTPDPLPLERENHSFSLGRRTQDEGRLIYQRTTQRRSGGDFTITSLPSARDGEAGGDSKCKITTPNSLIQ